jgi:hypothetical protein
MPGSVLLTATSHFPAVEQQMMRDSWVTVDFMPLHCCKAYYPEPIVIAAHGHANVSGAAR